MQPQDAPTSGFWANTWCRSGVLLLVLGALVLAVPGVRTSVFGLNSGGVQAGAFGVGCPGHSAPEVASISPRDLAKLGESLSRVLTPGAGQLYEQGIVAANSVWSDNSPTSFRPLNSLVAPQPAGYEMRWWARNRDDIVADVFEFATPSQAKNFFWRAASPHCRRDGVVHAASFPLQARNLLWVNPDGFIEEDVFFVRGRRVYRVVDVRPEQRHPVRPPKTEREIATSTVDILACALPVAVGRD